MDARQEKTIARLSAAILELATERPVTEVTVSELARTAGVHRSTVYVYAPSPVELLQNVLRAELDVLRADYLVGVEPDDALQAVEGVTRGVLVHVDRHDAIYRRGLGADSGSASLQAMLSAHFRGSIELLIDQHSVTVPSTIPAERRMVTRYLADGIIGGIDVWLDSPRPRDVDALLGVLDLVLPAWWPHRGQRGERVGAWGD